MAMNGKSPQQPVLVGTTGSVFQGTIARIANIESIPKEKDRHLNTLERLSSQAGSESNYFKGAQWSAFSASSH